MEDKYANLLEMLGIKRYFVFPDHLELRYQNNNQAIIAHGKTELEVITNFYELYKELMSDQWSNL